MRYMMPLAEGFEEIEAIAVIDILRRAGISVDTVGIMGSTVTGGQGIKLMVDKRLLEVNPDEYGGIILPGGNKGVENLGRSQKVVDIIKKFDSEKKLIAAICAAPSILASNGILDGRKATIFPGMERGLPHPRGEKVVVDGNVITSQAPGTAIEFALALVESISGKGKAVQIKRQIIA
jgi:4-methyl-5(b-hydroxyethyl)-thiazole monophosphate biosynthesis